MRARWSRSSCMLLISPHSHTMKTKAFMSCYNCVLSLKWCFPPRIGFFLCVKYTLSVALLTTINECWLFLFFLLFFLHAEALNVILFARFRYKWQSEKISFRPSCMSHLWLVFCTFVCKEMGKSVYMNVNHDEINLSLAYTWSTILRCAHNNSIAISSDCDSPTI